MIHLTCVNWVASVVEVGAKVNTVDDTTSTGAANEN